ncbi:hypothetical protein Ddc_24631 [Ditylenchus destructor]|nr:hypothetical protein Ddc_24631 [Ditylenchus destructor]
MATRGSTSETARQRPCSPSGPHHAASFQAQATREAQAAGGVRIGIVQWSEDRRRVLPFHTFQPWRARLAGTGAGAGGARPVGHGLDADLHQRIPARTCGVVLVLGQGPGGHVHLRAIGHRFADGEKNADQRQLQLIRVHMHAQSRRRLAG